MKNSCLTMAIVAACLLGLADSVSARVFPGSGGSSGGARAVAQFAGAAVRDRNSAYGAYGDYGGVTYIFSNSAPTGIGMQPGPSAPAYQPGLTAPAPSSSEMPRQAQTNQDWWFQNQRSQTKGAAWAPYEGPELSTRAAALYSAAAQDIGFEAARSLPRAALDVIKWPVLLRRPTFASRRTLIESPYRRSPPGLSTPTAEDYRAMAKTAGEMKAMLEWLARDGLETNSYEEAKRFLDQLEKEARERSEGSGIPLTPKS